MVTSCCFTLITVRYSKDSSTLVKFVEPPSFGFSKEEYCTGLYGKVEARFMIMVSDI